jgi:hypothetical protein
MVYKGYLIEKGRNGFTTLGTVVKTLCGKRLNSFDSVASAIYCIDQGLI